MDNQESKIQKWEFLKKEILPMIPNQYKIDVEGLDDDSEYFHPIIKLEDDIVIRGQADTRNDYVYGWDLQVKQQVGVWIKTVGFNIESLEKLNRILINWDKYKTKIKQYIEINKTINENIDMLQEIQNNIQDNLLNDMFLREDRKNCLNKLFTVKEWIENERVIENYTGIN